MKLIFATCLVAAAATADLSSFKFDPQNAMGELQTLMSGAQGKLNHAQKHHEKVVQKLRKATEKDFKDDMVTIEGAITDYSEDLATAERELQIAVNSSKAELKREQAIPTPVGDWDSKSSMEKAQLNAVIGSAERTVRHLDRHNDRDVREAEEQAGQVIEDQTTKLSMKLGDLTSLSDDAKKGISDHVTDESASFAVREQGKPAPKDAPLSGDEVTRLQAQGKKLQDAEKKSTADIAAAKKKFSAFLAKESATIEAQTDKVTSDLAAAEKKELDRIDGKVPPKKTAPVAKKIDAKKQPQKAKREQQEPRRLHNAVQKLSQKLTAKAKAAGPVNHAKVAAKKPAPGRRVAHMPTKTAGAKKVGHLPAMREATPAERRASAHKEEMKKMRALKKPAAPLKPPARHGAPAKKAEKKVAEKVAVPVKK